jgi:hypothetical protein
MAEQAEATVNNPPARLLYYSLALCLLAFVCFVPALSGQFVFDDHWTIVHNSAIRSFDRLPDLFSGKAVADQVPDAWRPLMVVSHMVDYRLFGLRPIGFHLHSLLWHMACVLVAFQLVWRLARRSELALVAAALYAVHPLVVEPVAAINYREDLLATFFSLAALTVLLDPVERRLRRFGWATLGAALLLGVGLLAKGTAAVTPLLFVALGLATRERLRTLLPTALGLSAVVGLFVLWRWVTAGAVNPYLQLGVSTAHKDAGGLTTMLTQAEVFARTAAQMVIPVGLSPEYGQALQAGFLGVVGLVLLVGLALAAVVLARRGHVVESWASFVICVGWIPASGLLPLPNLRADRYVYLPLLGFCLLAAALVARLGKRVQPAVVVLTLFVLGLLAVGQQGVWRSELALWTRAAQSAPDSSRAFRGLARAQAQDGRLTQAERTARHGLSILDSGNTRLVLANILARQRRLQDALEQYEGAHRLGVRHPAYLYASWGWIKHQAGGDDAEHLLRRAIRHDPSLALAHANLGQVLAAKGRHLAACRSMRAAVKLAPERSLYRRLLHQWGSEE